MANETKLLRVTDILRIAGICPPMNFCTQADLDFGSFVHQACEYDDEGKLDMATLDPMIVPRVEAWRKFRKETGFVPEQIEVRLNSEKWGVTGKPDRVGFLGGEYAIVDIKSGAIADWVGVQLAGYASLLGKQCIRVAVELKADGSYRMRKFDAYRDMDTFLAALHCATWAKNHGGK